MVLTSCPLKKICQRSFIFGFFLSIFLILSHESVFFVQQNPKNPPRPIVFKGDYVKKTSPLCNSK